MTPSLEEWEKAREALTRWVRLNPNDRKIYHDSMSVLDGYYAETIVIAFGVADSAPIIARGFVEMADLIVAGWKEQP